MTAFLSCDGCGEVVSDRRDPQDPTARWYQLTMGPAIGAALLPMISMSTHIDYEDEAPTPEPVDLPESDPDRHFCGLGCLAAWATRASTHP